MGKLLKKAVALCSALVCIGSVTNLYEKESYAAVKDVLLGDANGDKKVNISDAVLVNQYLAGMYQVDAYKLTCMDINQDYVIDSTDALMIQYVEIKTITADTVRKNLYTVPNAEARTYYRHNCSSSDLASKDSYTLSEPVSYGANSVSAYADLIIEKRDRENTNVVQIKFNGGGGSGFIVGSHIIATAAHCVYDKSNNRFVNNVKINIYDKEGEVNASHLVHTSSAKELHVPQEYVNLSYGNEDNYDYALIYVEDDLSEYGIWSMGIPTDEFMNSGKQLTTSGFRSFSADSELNKTYPYARYYDENTVVPYSSDWGHNKLEYRITSKSLSYPGKSGGILYYKSDYNSTLAKSALGVVTGAANPTTGGDTWATRITPTLLQFYKQNTQINKY